MKNKKHIIFLLCVLSIFPVFISAQSYIPFPDSGAVWKETYWWQPSPFFYNGIGDTYIEGDTVFNDTIYKKIYNLRRDVYCSDIIISGPDYSGALREDTVEKRIYLRGSANYPEALLYDYTLQLGDTLPEEMYWMMLYPGVFVSNIDTIITNDSISRKVWYLDHEIPFEGWPQVIEGIGYTSGLKGGIEPYWEGWNELLCFSIDGDEVWRSWRDTCYVFTDSCATVGINEARQPEVSIKYYPNPVSTSSTISFELNQFQASKNYLWIFDLYGKEISSKEFKDKSFSIKSPANKGVYIVRIFVSNHYYTFKIIVSN